MPYQLNFAGNNATLRRRIAPFPLPTSFAQDFRIDVTFIHASSSDYQAIINTPDDAITNNNFFVGCGPSGVLYFWSNNSQLNSSVTPVAGSEYVVSITVSTSKVVGISVNGSSYATKSYPNLSASLYNLILSGGTTNAGGTTFRDPFVGQLRRVETWVGGSKTGDYTNTTGSGTTLVNSIGGAVATQAGTWPSDNSEWVFYSSGGGTTQRMKYYNGTSWVAKPLKYYNGSAWVEKPIKYHNGTSWT